MSCAHAGITVPSCIVLALLLSYLASTPCQAPTQRQQMHIANKIEILLAPAVAQNSVERELAGLNDEVAAAEAALVSATAAFLGIWPPQEA